MCSVCQRWRERHISKSRREHTYLEIFILCLLYLFTYPLWPAFVVAFVTPALECLVLCLVHNKHFFSTCLCPWGLHWLAMPKNWSDSPSAPLLVGCFMGEWPWSFFILTGIKCPYCPQPSIDSVQPLSRFQWYFFPELEKTMLKFIFPQAISLPMICPLLEQADYRGSFTAMCLKISGIEIEFESPHGMAGSGENWRGTPMTGWVIADLRHPASQIWPSQSSSRLQRVGSSPPYLRTKGHFWTWPALHGWLGEHSHPHSHW